MSAKPIREMEYELKLDLGDERQYRRLVATLGSVISDTTQVNYFFDTSDNHLMKSLWALRIRTSAESDSGDSESSLTAEIALKGPQEGTGDISARNEISAELPLEIATASIAGGFDLSALELAPVVEARKIIGAEKLIPLVSFRNRRLLYDMKPECEFPLEVDLTTYSDNLTRYELEIEFPEADERNIAHAQAYIRELFEKLGIPYLPQPTSKLAVALQKRSLLN